MRVADEPNVDALRQKARILERENERLSEKVSDLLREVLALRGMAPTEIELNLPGLEDKAAGRKPDSPSGKSERRGGDRPASEKPKKPGHGPTPQEELDIESERHTLADDEKECRVCGKQMEAWAGKDDVVDVVHRVPARWVIKRCTLEKCRCPDGCSIVTAKGPKKLIAGGRYTVDVAIFSSIDKFLFHIPIERQTRQAKQSGMVITSQTLWDQQLALANQLSPLVDRIKRHILAQDWLGVDLTPFLQIKKGGSASRQVWQLACPEARYFEMHDDKSAKTGCKLFQLKDDKDNVVQTFAGIAVADGAAELAKVGKMLGFGLANCWSHARRNVRKAESEAPGQVEQFLKLTDKLYEIERRLAGVTRGKEPVGGYRRRLDLGPLRSARDKESRVVTEEVRQWMLAQRCIPGGKLRAGLDYVAGHWTGLTRFLDDPRIPLDNNVSEAGFVGIAQGRRNYVGCRSKRGMDVATKFYTVVESARVCGADPDKYLRYAAGVLLDGGAPLLPHEWLRSER